jgi:hypothetical protein
MSQRLRWTLNAELVALVRRYYRGEAALWPTICAQIENQLRQQSATVGAYHLRFQLRPDDGYDVIVEDASDYAQ